MHYLSFDISEGDDGVTTLEALASTPVAQHDAVMAEVQQVLDWAWQHFPRTHGPVEDGRDWDHDVQIQVEEGGWHTVSLTLTASARVSEDFLAAFGTADD
jgi:hypothetical protein